jgi:alpha-glucosidase
MTPVAWLSYVFYTHMQRKRNVRPVIYNRYGGLGDQRYPIGFSGDAVAKWPTLHFQPYFTATASNVGFGYWAHDIGGFYNNAVDSPELFTRWLQWGAFSPMLKTHFTKNAIARRRIWTYPYLYARAMRKAILLRYKLIPYIYTAARDAYDTGVSILRPMYYGWPWQNEAYEFKDEYMFGRDLLVSPVTHPMGRNRPQNTPHLLATKKIWLPKGTWVEWPTGRIFRGDTTIERHYSIYQIPVFARQGAVIPMQTRQDFKR